MPLVRGMVHDRRGGDLVSTVEPLLSDHPRGKGGWLLKGGINLKFNASLRGLKKG